MAISKKVSPVKKLIRKLTNFSFGGTSAIITNISLIIGLGTSDVSKSGIIGGLLVIALADNISDSLGIHIYKESESNKIRETLISTLSNFFTRLLVSFTFIGVVLMFSTGQAQIIAAVWGLFLIGVISYFICRKNQSDPTVEIATHIAIAILVIIASKYMGYLIHEHLTK